MMMEISNCLLAIKVNGYDQLFIMNGYDSLEIIKEISNIVELLDIGI